MKNQAHKLCIYGSLIFTTVLLLFTSFSSSAQTSFNWAGNMGGNSSNIANSSSTAVDPSGNIYTVGVFGGTVDFDPGVATVNLTSSSGIQSFITKFDANGTFIWVKHISSTMSVNAEDIKLDAAGNIYVIGDFAGQVDFDLSGGVYNLLATGGTSAFVLKLNNIGNFVWAKKLDIISAASPNHAMSFVIDPLSNIYITGDYGGTVDFDPSAATYTMTTSASTRNSFVWKLDVNGDFVWAKNFGSSSTVGTTSGQSINIDFAGDIYTAGYYTGTVDFDPSAAISNLTPVGANDICILKLNSVGNFVWAKSMGGAGYDYAYSIVTDPSGNVFTTGSYENTADFNPGAGTFTLTGTAAKSIFISKLDVNGNFSWAGKFGNGSGNAITTDQFNNIFVTGSYIGTSDFNPGTGTYNLTSAGSDDIFISKLSNNGTFISANTIGNTASDIGKTIETDGNGAIYITGDFINTVDFNPFAATSFLLSGTGYDVFVLKLSDCIAPTAPVNTTTISNQTICNGTAAVLSATSTGTVNWYATSSSTVILSSGTNYTTSSLPTGTYTYYAAAFTCTNSTSRTAITVTVNASPTVSVNSGSICSGNSFTINPTGAGTYTISGGSSVVTPTSKTSYSVTGTSVEGCLSSNTAVSSLTVNSIPVVLVNSGSICSGNSFTINPTGAGTYTISGGSSVVTPTSNTSYNVTGTSTQGCVSSNTAVSSVTVNSLPTISVNSGSICSGSSFTINPIGANTYTISGGSAIVSPTTNASYNVTGTSTQGCVSSNTAVSSVTVNAKPTVSVNSGSICSGSSFTISPTGANTYTISGGSAIVSPTTNASYNVTGTSAQGCVSSNTAVSSVTVNAKPAISVNNGSICSGASFTINPTGASTYTISGGLTVVTPTTNTSYNVTGTSAQGCVSTNTAVSSVTVNTLPNVTAITNNTLLCTGQTATLTANGASTYLWNTSVTTSIIAISPTVTTNYTVTGTDVNGCSNSVVLTQSVSLCTGINSQIVTPNSQIVLYPNPSNGVFTISAIEQNTSIGIYNAIGELVKSIQSTDSNTTIDLSNYSNGIYFIKVKNNKGEAIQKLIKQ